MKEKKFKRYKEPLLDRMDRKYGRYAPRNIMTFIVIVTALVWLLDAIVLTRTDYNFSVANWLYFDRELILQGQVWRAITFIFIPEWGNIFYLALGLYFYWMIADALESEWGAFRFDVYYLCGVIGAIISGFITGFATNYYLNLSLFLAFAILYPDYQFLLFFFIPVKVKYLAILDFILILLDFIVYPWIYRLAIIMALINIILFFWRDYLRKIQQYFRRRKYKREATRKSSDDYPFDL